MAWTKSAWANVIGTNTTKTTLTSNSSTSGTFDCNGANPYVVAGVKIVAVISSSPADDITIRFLGIDADNANEPDTVPLYEAEISAVTSSEERATYQINVSGLDTLRVWVYNDDDADAVDIWVSAIGGYPS